MNSRSPFCRDYLWLWFIGNSDEKSSRKNNWKRRLTTLGSRGYFFSYLHPEGTNSLVGISRTDLWSGARVYQLYVYQLYIYTFISQFSCPLQTKSNIHDLLGTKPPLSSIRAADIQSAGAANPQLYGARPYIRNFKHLDNDLKQCYKDWKFHFHSSLTKDFVKHFRFNTWALKK